MFLPNATLFPQALLPLRIFEPRYRKMLAFCLEGSRMFCLALLKPGAVEARSTADFHHVAGLGIVRACVTEKDGSANLILQGVARVRFTQFLQETPFRIAQFEPLRPGPIISLEAQMLTTKLLSICGELRHGGLPVPTMLDEQLSKTTDPNMLADIVAHNFVRDPQRRQEVMEQSNVSVRLRALIRHLREEMEG